MICFSPCTAFCCTDFKWTFNNSAESIDVAASHVSRHGKWSEVNERHAYANCVIVVVWMVTSWKMWNCTHIKHIMVTTITSFMPGDKNHHQYADIVTFLRFSSLVERESFMKKQEALLIARSQKIKWKWKIRKTLQLGAKWKILTQFVSALCDVAAATAPLCTRVLLNGVDRVHTHTRLYYYYRIEWRARVNETRSEWDISNARFIIKIYPAVCSLHRNIVIC